MALVLAIGLGVVVTRVFWDGRAALAEGDAAMARGDVKEAVVKLAARRPLVRAGRPARRRRLRTSHRAGPRRRRARRRRAGPRRVAGDPLVVAGHTFAVDAVPRAAGGGQRAHRGPDGEQEVAADPAKDEAARRAMHLGFLGRDERRRCRGRSWRSLGSRCGWGEASILRGAG